MHALCSGARRGERAGELAQGAAVVPSTCCVSCGGLREAGVSPGARAWGAEGVWLPNCALFAFFAFASAVYLQGSYTCNNPTPTRFEQAFSLPRSTLVLSGMAALIDNIAHLNARIHGAILS